MKAYIHFVRRLAQRELAQRRECLFFEKIFERTFRFVGRINDASPQSIESIDDNPVDLGQNLERVLDLDAVSRNVPTTTLPLDANFVHDRTRGYLPVP